MRIAIVSDYYLDYVGGAQTSMLAQRAALEAAGHEVLVLAPERGRRRTETSDDGIRLSPSFRLPVLDLPVVKNRPPLIAMLETFLRERAVDVVHVQTEFGLAQAVTTAAYGLQVPVVHTVHTFYWQSTGSLPTLAAPLVGPLLRNLTRAKIGDTPLSERPTDSILRNLTLAMAERADVVVSPSIHQAKDLEEALVERPVAVVPNPAAAAGTPPRPLTDSVPRFLWVARCEPEKRPLVFAQAILAARARTMAPFEVDIVGEGSELAKVRALVGREPGVRVHGALPHADVLDLIDASAIVAITSVGFDNQPMTIAEAVSRHRGILYCDPALTEGLERAGARTASPSADGIADMIVGLVEHPERLAQLSAGAAADAADFAPATFVDRIVTVYQRAEIEAH
jgi:glycosyltransferase involved in cell wall biosynthesis